jgi:hypothetical protein
MILPTTVLPPINVSQQQHSYQRMTFTTTVLPPINDFPNNSAATYEQLSQLQSFPI